MNTEASPMTHLQGSLIVLAVGFTVSFGALVFRFASDQGTADSWEYLFFRGLGMFIATCLVLVVRSGTSVGAEIAKATYWHWLAGVVLGFISCIFIVALSRTTVAFVLLMQTLAPIVAGYFSWVMLREKISPQAIVATVVSIVGVLIMFSGSLSEGINVGAVLALFIPLGFGLYGTMIRASNNLNPAVPLLTAGVVLMAAGLVVVTVVGDGFSVAVKDGLLGMFAGSFLLGFPLAFFNVAQKVVPSPETALLLMSEVVLAPLWAWLFVDEVPAATTLVGGAVILAAVVWLTLSRAKAKG